MATQDPCTPLTDENPSGIRWAFKGQETINNQTQSDYFRNDFEMPDTETSVLLYWATKNKNGLCFKLLVQKKNEHFSVTFVSPLENDLSQVPNPPSENPIPKKKMFEPLRSCTGHLFKDFFYAK